MKVIVILRLIVLPVGRVFSFSDVTHSDLFSAPLLH
jgi:hypothetical protein